MHSWDKLAAALCKQWNVVAADLQNEPHSSSWGKGGALDWNKAAERIGAPTHPTYSTSCVDSSHV